MMPKELIELQIIGIHDAAHDAWSSLHKNDGGGRGYYNCRLCGATMYECFDYTHKPSCPTEVLDRAIGAYREAILKTVDCVTKAE